MITALIAAVVAQWILLLAMAIMIVVLLRQVGQLHERLGPVGALVLPGGPQPGSLAPQFDLQDLSGRLLTIGGPSSSGASTLLFFLSPTCPVCKSLVPVVTSIAKGEGDRLRLVLASDGDEPAQRKMQSELKLEGYPLVLSTALGLAYQVSKLPHAVLIDADGKIAAKGLVNNREHLESLFEARDRGVASLQEFVRTQTDRAPAGSH